MVPQKPAKCEGKRVLPQTKNHEDALRGYSVLPSFIGNAVFLSLNPYFFLAFFLAFFAGAFFFGAMVVVTPFQRDRVYRIIPCLPE